MRVDTGRRVGAGARRFHDAYLRRVKLLHHFFDRHIREVLRVEHEAVVLVELGKAEARLVVRVEFLDGSPRRAREVRNADT